MKTTLFLFFNILFINCLYSQVEFDDLLTYKKAQVKSITYESSNLEVESFYKYFDHKIYQQNPSGQIMYSSWDTFYIQNNRIDSIYTIDFGFMEESNIYAKHYFYYSKNQLNTETIITRGNTKKVFKKHIYNSKGRLDQLQSYTIGIDNDTMLQSIYNIKCNRKGKILSKDLIKGKNNLQSVSFKYDRKGRLIYEKKTYNTKTIFMSNSKDNEGATMEVREYKYNKKNLKILLTESYYLIKPDGNIIKEISLIEKIGYEFY